MEQPLRLHVKRALRSHPAALDRLRSSVYLARGIYGRTIGRSLAANWRSYLAQAEEPKLHLGCGDFLLPGWLNTDAFPRRRDVAYCNATRRFPFPSNSFACVFTEHMIEHLTHQQGRHLIAEAYRVLRPGGVLRIATPDLDRIIALKSAQPGELEQRYLSFATEDIHGATPGSPCFAINNFVRAWGHQFIYDSETLMSACRDAGFVEMRQHAPGHSDVAALRDLERHGDIFPDPAFNLVETLVVEAVKPLS